MAKQKINPSYPDDLINVGRSVNDKSGDPLRGAFIKINDAFDRIDSNFTELYASPGGGTANTGNLGFDADTIYDINGMILANSDLTHGATARILIPENGDTVVPLTLQNNYGAVTVITGSSPDYYWTFGDDGSLTLPNNLKITNDGETAFIGSGSLSTQVVEDISGTTSTITVGESQVEIDPTAIVIRRRTTQTVDDGVVTTTDEAGSLASVGNGAAFLKTYSEPDGPNNTQYAEVGTNGNFAYLESKQEDVGGYTLGGVVTSPGSVAITTHSVGDKQWLFDQDGILTLPSNSYLETTDVNLKVGAQGTVTIRSNAESSLTDREWTFDRSGTLSTPLMLPTSFTATCDGAHLISQEPRAFGPDGWWYFEVHFVVNPNGEVATQIGNDTPWPSNPGYLNNDQFAFTEEDHGIPGYTFTLTLVDIQTPGPMMVTTNLAASIPPEYPSTVNTSGAVKITSNGNDLIFGTTGNLNLPAYSNLPGDTKTGINFGDGTLQTTAFKLDQYSNLSITNFVEAGGFTNYSGAVYVRTSRPDAESTMDFVFDETGKFTVPPATGVDINWTSDTGDAGNHYDSLRINNDHANGLYITNTLSGVPYSWLFSKEGNLKLPAGGDIVDSTGSSVLGGSAFTGDLGSNTLTQNFSFTNTTNPNVSIGAGTVVWTSQYDYISSAKLLIQVECSEVGDNTGWHSQVCEAVISSRGYGNGQSGYGDPQMVVYGIVHTSVDPLVTFTVQRNPTTKTIEVVGTLTAAAGGDADLRIHSVEMATRD